MNANEGVNDQAKKDPGNQTPNHSGSNEDSTVSEQERELARQSKEQFAEGDYTGCAGIICKLEQLRPQDLKVTHNKIIVDYYKSNDPKRTEILKKSLNAIYGQGSGSGSKSGPNSVGNTSMVNQSGKSNSASNAANSTSVPSTTLQETEDIEKSVIRYNQAVILYHLGQYEAALKIVVNLFCLVELMEEHLVHKLCLLLIELHLALGRPDDALSFLNYIECQFTLTDPSKSPLEQNTTQKLDNTAKPNIKPVIASVVDNKDQKKDSIDNATEAFRLKLLKYKLRIYLKTLQVGLCVKEWNTLVSLGMPRNLSSIFLEANLEYLKRNFKQSTILLNNIRNERCPDFRSCGESIAVLYYNNIAAIHFAQGKPNLACYYLQQALDENKKALESIKKDDANVLNPKNPTSPSPLPSLHTLGWKKHYELNYSLGVSLLYSGQPVKAFDCFTETAQHYHNNPRLWLRMAECCIMCHKQSNIVDFNVNGRKKDILQKIVGENNGVGISRKFILATSLSQNVKYNPQGLSHAIPQPTLEFGMLCLKNACFLLKSAKKEEPSIPIIKHPLAVGDNEEERKLTLDSSLSFSPNHKIGNNIHSNSQNNSNQRQSFVHMSESSQTTIVENLNLTISILAASSYVSLCLGDYKPALTYAKSLLNIQRLPGAYWLLGHLYAAESLIFLDRIDEALEHLKPDNLQNINTYIPIEEQKDQKERVEILGPPSTRTTWFPNTIPTAKVMLKYNLAVAFAIRGELDKSGDILKMVWGSKNQDCDVPIYIIMLALYIELQLGHVEIARSLIKQHYGIKDYQ